LRFHRLGAWPSCRPSVQNVHLPDNLGVRSFVGIQASWPGECLPHTFGPWMGATYGSAGRLLCPGPNAPSPPAACGATPTAALPAKTNGFHKLCMSPRPATPTICPPTGRDAHASTHGRQPVRHASGQGESRQCIRASGEQAELPIIAAAGHNAGSQCTMPQGLCFRMSGVKWRHNPFLM
jgi:hypothetical protein